MVLISIHQIKFYNLFSSTPIQHFQDQCHLHSFFQNSGNNNNISVNNNKKQRPQSSRKNCTVDDDDDDDDIPEVGFAVTETNLIALASGKEPKEMSWFRKREIEENSSMDKRDKKRRKKSKFKYLILYLKNGSAYPKNIQ